MPDEQENIEAALAAYLDGELAPPDRAQIERHLSTNAEHRKLLDLLSGQRAALRSLPREAAPIDMSETVQAQLERSVLLDRIEDATAHSSLRSDRWRQWRAVAAVLMLTAGLSALIYVIFPKGNAPAEFATVKQAEGIKSATVLADEEKSTTLPSVASRAAEEVGMGSKELAPVEPTISSPVPASTAEKRAIGLASGPVSITAAPGAVGNAPTLDAPARDRSSSNEFAGTGNGRPEDQSPAGKDAIMKSIATVSGDDLALKTQVAGNIRYDPQGGEANRVVVLVTTDDPVATRGQVARFFADNRIEFAAVPTAKTESAATVSADSSSAQSSNLQMTPTSPSMNTGKVSDGKESDSWTRQKSFDLDARQHSTDEGEGDGYLARRIPRSQVAALNAQIGQARANQRAQVVDQPAAPARPYEQYGRAATQPASAPATMPATSPTTAGDVVDALYVVQSSLARTLPTTTPATVPAEPPATQMVP